MSSSGADFSNKLVYKVLSDSPKYVALQAPENVSAAVWSGGLQLFHGANAKIMATLAANGGKAPSVTVAPRASKRMRAAEKKSQLAALQEAVLMYDNDFITQKFNSA